MRSSITRTTAALLAACTACQSYAAIDPSLSATGTDVRVTLNEAGTSGLVTQLGAPMSVLEGRLQSATDSSVVIAVAQATRLNGVEDRWKGERVVIPSGDIARVDRKSISIGRSIVFGVALASGAFLIANAIGGGQATGSSNGTPPPGTGQ